MPDEQSKIRVGHVDVTVGDVAGALAQIEAAAIHRRPVSFKFVNAYSVALAESDEQYRRELSNGVNFPDGTPVAWLAGRLSGAAGPQRPVRGPEVFERAMLGGALPGRRHYFLGGTQETVDKLVARVHREAPDVIIAGTWSPPYAPVGEILADSIHRIRSAKPDVVWLGLGTPKQDLLAARLAQLVCAPCVGVGAAFDFLSGQVSEAPVVVRGSGFEWLYRLSQDPRRLWKRYTIGNLIFARATFASLCASLVKAKR